MKIKQAVNKQVGVIILLVIVYTFMPNYIWIKFLMDKGHIIMYM